MGIITVMLQFAPISLLLTFCLLLGIACSSNESTNQRTGGSSTSAENESDDDEDLFGGLVFPPEDSLVSYLTAEVKNSRVRCEYKDDNPDNTFLSCVVVVVQYDGRELLPLKKSPGLKIDWKNLQNSVGNFLGDCTPSLDKLSASCKIDKFDDQTLSNDRLVIAGANFSDGNEAALRQDTVKLKLKIGVVAGLVPNVPVKYVSQDMLQSSTSLNLSDNSESVGFQPLSSGLKDQVVLNDRGLGFIGSACIREKKIYFSSGLNIFGLKIGRPRTQKFNFTPVPVQWTEYLQIRVKLTTGCGFPIKEIKLSTVHPMDLLQSTMAMAGFGDSGMIQKQNILRARELEIRMPVFCVGKIK